MQYSAILLALAAGVFAIPQASTITSAPASVVSANLTPQQSCAIACSPGDVNCQAACVGAAHPNSSQVVETSDCAAKCDQGDGSPEATQKFSDCVQSCIASYFPTTQTVPLAAGSSAASAASNAASATGSLAASGVSNTASVTGSAATGSSTGAAAKSSGAANANTVQIAGAGFAGLLALFAL